MDAVIYAARSKDEEAGKDSTGDHVTAIRRRIGEVDGRTIVGDPHIDHASGFKGNRGPRAVGPPLVAVSARERSKGSGAELDAPSKRIEVDVIQITSHAWAKRFVVVNWPNRRLPR